MPNVSGESNPDAASGGGQAAPISITSSQTLSAQSGHPQVIFPSTTTLFAATLPASSTTIGQIIDFIQTGTAGMRITCPSGVFIKFDTSDTTQGGSLTISQQYAGCTLYNAPNTNVWMMLDQSVLVAGAWTFT